MSAIISALRDGAWLTWERVQRWSWTVLALTIAFVIFLGSSAHGPVDFMGRPLGTDFSAFYAAGRLVLAGADPYDQAALHHVEQALFGTGVPYYGFAYPPVFLLVAVPLAALPYFVALILWQGASFTAYLWAMNLVRRGFASPLPTGTFLLAAAAFSAVVVNIGHGQNGFLTAALFGIALAMLDRRPWMAGFCFALLAYKPQMAILIPFALGAGGRWRTFIAAAITLGILIAATIPFFGVESWAAFWGATQLWRHIILDQGRVGYEKMASIFAWMRLWHAPLAAAYAVQGVASITVLIGVVRTWQMPVDARLKGAALCAGAIVATPFALDYDLMLMAPAIALMAAHGREKRFAPYEAAVLALMWIAPLLNRPLAGTLFLPIATWCAIALFVFACRRTFTTA